MSPTNPDPRSLSGRIERRSDPHAGGSRASRRTLLIIAAIVVAGVLVAAALVLSLGGPRGFGGGPFYSTPQELQPSDFAALNATATPGSAFASNNTLWFPGGALTMVVYASPPDHDLTFVIQGLVNPTIHVAAGSRISLTVVNLDLDMYHNWAVSTQGPPYNSMPMMGGGMMSGGTWMTTSMLGPGSPGGYWSQDASFSPSTGSYWYLCTYVDHAADGMYGSFVVG